MVSFTLSAGVALLATAASAMVLPVRDIAPFNCTATYTVLQDDNCKTVVSKYNNFTSVDLYAWNPFITRFCFLDIGDQLCISGPPGYNYTGPIQAGTILTAGQNPAPIQSVTTVSNCAKFEYTTGGLPAFSQLLKSNGITEKQWDDMNFPGSNETNFEWNDYFSCVATK